MNKSFLVAFVVGVATLGLVLGGNFFAPSVAADEPLPGEANPIGSNKDTDGDNPMLPGCIAQYTDAQCTTAPPMNINADYCFLARGPNILTEFFATDAQGNPVGGAVCGGPQYGAKNYDCNTECVNLGFGSGTCGRSVAQCFGQEFHPALCDCTQ